MSGNCVVVVLGLVGMAMAAEQPTADRNWPGELASPRQVLDQNGGWRFVLGDRPVLAQPGFDDSDWESVTLPHSWNDADAWDDEPGYQRAVGWYRKRIALPDELRGRMAVLRIGAANQVAEVFVDGEPVTRHVGGYSAFTVDLTTPLAVEGEALVAIRVDNRWNADVPPLDADFTFYGGIYRHVRLIVADPIHIDFQDHAGPGIYIDTPRVSDAAAAVRVRGRVINASDGGAAGQIVTIVRDASGAEVARLETTATFARTEPTPFIHTLRIADPRRWSPDEPALYTATVTVHIGSEPRDAVTQQFGIRTLRFDPDKGFFLNGERLPLRGTNRHQDRKGQGVLLTEEQHIADLTLIKAMGANFVRLAHYPQDDAVLAACDRLGLLVWEEIPVVNYVTRTDGFRENARAMLRDMLRQHYNHASIILWGYMNEIFLFGPDGKFARSIDDAEYAAWVVDLAKELEALTRTEDPTRFTAMAGHGTGVYDQYGIADVPQVWGWNVYFGWYGDDFDYLSEFLDRQHREYPRRVLMVSEYGAGSDRRLHSAVPARFDFSIEWQQRFHEAYLRQFAERPYLAGTAIWNQFDFAAEHRGDSIPHLNQKGVAYYDRTPKDVFYLYQAAWRHTPVMHIAVRDWPERVLFVGAGARPTMQEVVIYTNQPRVELWLNGASLGQRALADGEYRITFPVRWRIGENELIARSVHSRRGFEDQARVTVHAATLDPPRRLAVNVGGSAAYIANDGTHWLADQEYAPARGWGYLGAESQRHVGGGPNILGTTDDALYQAYRRGLSGYRFDVPDGDYTVRLLFAEIGDTAAGTRIFSIGMNGEPSGPPLDIAAAAGPARPLEKRLTANVTGGKGLHVTFEPQTGEPILCGITVVADDR
jgi:beta-galactosidase